MTNPDVLVIGAGPVGLATALFACRRGLSVTVLERDTVDRPRPGSRALFVHRASLDRLERARPGLGRRIGDFGVVWTVRRTRYRSRQVYERRYREHRNEGLPPFTSLRQPDTERMLRAASLDAGAELVCDAPVTELDVGEDVVRVGTATGRQWQAPFVVACDGARSTVRSCLGVPLDGERVTAYHTVVDIAAGDAAVANERVFHYHHPEMAGRHVLVVAFRGGCQVDVQCADDDDAAGLASQVSSWLPRILDGDAPGRVMSTARYPFLQRVATRFTDGTRRVLLAGDAAHLFAPFGARGMNSGFADAEAAVAAIVSALAGNDRFTAVDGYADARRAAAHRNRSAVAAALRHMHPVHGFVRAEQRAAALFSPLWSAAGRWLDRAPYGMGRRASGPDPY